MKLLLILGFLLSTGLMAQEKVIKRNSLIKVSDVNGLYFRTFEQTYSPSEPSGAFVEKLEKKVKPKIIRLLEAEFNCTDSKITYSEHFIMGTGRTSCASPLHISVMVNYENILGWNDIDVKITAYKDGVIISQPLQFTVD